MPNLQGKEAEYDKTESIGSLCGNNYEFGKNLMKGNSYMSGLLHSEKQAEYIKLGMIGCGCIRPQHMSGIFDEASDIKVTAACDISRERLTAFCTRYGVKEAFATPEEMFSSGRVDAVSIAVKPESDKVRLSIDALDHGLHVLAEKPMALTVKEAEAMAVAARRSGKVLQIAFNRRFEPVYSRVAEIVKDRPLFGDVVNMDACYNAACKSPYVMFMAQTPHTLDTIQYFAGRVASLRSIVRKTFNRDEFTKVQEQPWHPSELEYNRKEPGLVGIAVATTLTFVSGAVGTMRISTHSSGGRLGSDRFEINGTENKSVVVDNFNRAVFIQPKGQEEIFGNTSCFRRTSSYGLEYRHFADCVYGKQPSVIPLEESLWSVYFYEGFLRSLNTEEKINLIEWKEE